MKYKKLKNNVDAFLEFFYDSQIRVINSDRSESAPLVYTKIFNFLQPPSCSVPFDPWVEIQLFCVVCRSVLSGRNQGGSLSAMTAGRGMGPTG